MKLRIDHLDTLFCVLHYGYSEPGNMLGSNMLVIKTLNYFSSELSMASSRTVFSYFLYSVNDVVSKFSCRNEEILLEFYSVELELSCF